MLDYDSISRELDFIQENYNRLEKLREGRELHKLENNLGITIQDESLHYSIKLGDLEKEIGLGKKEIIGFKKVLEKYIGYFDLKLEDIMIRYDEVEEYVPQFECLSDREINEMTNMTKTEISNLESEILYNLKDFVIKFTLKKRINDLREKLNNVSKP
jgi:hypothetical protein